MAAWHESGKGEHDPWTLSDWLVLLAVILEVAAMFAIVHWNIHA